METGLQWRLPSTRLWLRQGINPRLRGPGSDLEGPRGVSWVKLEGNSVHVEPVVCAGEHGTF